MNVENLHFVAEFAVSFLRSIIADLGNILFSDLGYISVRNPAKYTFRKKEKDFVMFFTGIGNLFLKL